MNFTRSIIGGIFFSFIFSLAGAQGSIPEVRAFFEPSSISVGKEISLVVEMEQSGPNPGSILLPENSLEVAGLKYLGRSQQALVENPGDKQICRHRVFFRYRALSSGTVISPAFDLNFQPQGETQSMLIAVPSARLEVSAAPGIFSRFWGYFLGLVVFILAGLYIRWQIRRFQDNSSALVAEVSREFGLEASSQIKEAGKLLLEGDRVSWASRMEDILSSYLKERFSLQDQDLLDQFSFHGRLSGESSAEATKLLNTLRSLRYGNYLPEGISPRELEKRMGRFILNTSGDKIVNSGSLDGS